MFLDPIRALENEYNNSWVLPNGERPARHHPMIGYSEAFCRVFDQDGYVLFRVGPWRQETGLIQADDLPEPPPELQEGPAPPYDPTPPPGPSDESSRPGRLMPGVCSHSARRVATTT